MPMDKQGRVLTRQGKQGYSMQWCWNEWKAGSVNKVECNHHPKPRSCELSCHLADELTWHLGWSSSPGQSVDPEVDDLALFGVSPYDPCGSLVLQITDYQLPITNYQMAPSKRGAGGGSATHKEPT